MTDFLFAQKLPVNHFVVVAVFVVLALVVLYRNKSREHPSSEHI